LAKTLKILLQQFVKRLGNFWQLGKNQPPARKYMRAARIFTHWRLIFPKLPKIIKSFAKLLEEYF